MRGNLGQQCSHGSRPLALAAPIRLYRSQPVTRRPRTGAERPGRASRTPAGHRPPAWWASATRPPAGAPPGTRHRRRARAPSRPRSEWPIRRPRFELRPVPWGLSPRVRGNRIHPRDRARARGSIPACAGEPRCRSPHDRQPRVYPRVCGGTTNIPDFGIDAVGLSPRVRGNLCVRMTPAGSRPRKWGLYVKEPFWARRTPGGCTGTLRRRRTGNLCLQFGHCEQVDHQLFELAAASVAVCGSR